MTSTAISAQGSILQISGTTGSAKTLTAAAVGYPTIITSATHGLQNGDIVTMANWAGTGAALLNGLSFVVQDVTTNTFMVEVNTTGLTLTTGSTPTATPVTWTNINNLKTFTGFDGEASEIDVTNLSSTAKEYRLGLVDNGKFSIEVDYDGADNGQIACKAAQVSGALKNFKLTLPDTHTYSFAAFVKKVPLSGGVDQVVKISTIDLRISGAVTIV
jgi:hypothetical protein